MAVSLSEVRNKWNRRYAEKTALDLLPTPNPLAMRLKERVRGGVMLDAACGLGAGVAALIDRVDFAVAADLSDEAVRKGSEVWRHEKKITWLQADVSRAMWRTPCFDVICAFGYTDWPFLRRVASMLKTEGLFFYQGFSERQLTVKPDMDPAWTSTPESIAQLFPGFEVLVSEESEAPPFRVGFAAKRPAPYVER